MKKTLLALLFMLMALSIFAQEAGTAVADAPVSAPSAEPAPAAAEPVPVMGLTVDKDKLLLFTGNPATKLGVTVNPPEATDKTLVWTSSNPEVVTVSEAGEITPVKPGMATVSVVARDGGMPFDILVEVKENVPVVALTLDKTTYTLALGVGNLQLRPSVVPANAPSQELVSSSDRTLGATEDNTGGVNARAPGKARIMARTADGKFQAFCLITVTKDYVPVQSVMLDRPMLSIVAGSASRQLVPTILPANANYKDVELTSSDP